MLTRLFKKISPRHDEHGRELADQTVLAIPAGFEKPETLDQKLARMFKAHLNQHAAQTDHDTFEEYDDFEDEDSEWHKSGFEVSEISPPHLQKPVEAAPQQAPEGSGGGRPPESPQAPPAPKKRVKRIIEEYEDDN